MGVVQGIQITPFLYEKFKSPSATAFY